VKQAAQRQAAERPEQEPTPRIQRDGRTTLRVLKRLEASKRTPQDRAHVQLVRSGLNCGCGESVSLTPFSPTTSSTSFEGTAALSCARIVNRSTASGSAGTFAADAV
jgi:hypothetical protein